MLIKTFGKYLLGVCLLTGGSSLFACDVNAISIRPESTQSTYDVFNSSNYASVNTYRIQADISGEACMLKVMLQLEDASRSLKNRLQEKLAFEWYGQIGSAVANQWHLTLTENQPTATIQMRFPSKQWLTAGAFTGVLEMSLPTSADNTLGDARYSSLPIVVNVPPVAKIHYYGSSQRHYDLVLGELYSNKVINTAPNLWVQSNSGYTIVLSSKHRGALRHKSNNPAWDIPYQMTLDHNTVDLTQIEAYINRNASTFGQPLPMTFVIGDTKEKPGGQYEDTLEISIEPHLSQQPYF